MARQRHDERVWRERVAKWERRGDPHTRVLLLEFRLPMAPSASNKASAVGSSDQPPVRPKRQPRFTAFTVAPGWTHSQLLSPANGLKDHDELGGHDGTLALESARIPDRRLSRPVHRKRHRSGRRLERRRIRRQRRPPTHRRSPARRPRLGKASCADPSAEDLSLASTSRTTWKLGIAPPAPTTRTYRRCRVPARRQHGNRGSRPHIRVAGRAAELLAHHFAREVGVTKRRVARSVRRGFAGRIALAVGHGAVGRAGIGDVGVGSAAVRTRRQRGAGTSCATQTKSNPGNKPHLRKRSKPCSSHVCHDSRSAAEGARARSRQSPILCRSAPVSMGGPGLQTPAASEGAFALAGSVRCMA